jgi:hypothetical protein
MMNTVLLVPIHVLLICFFFACKYSKCAIFWAVDEFTFLTFWIKEQTGQNAASSFQIHNVYNSSNNLYYTRPDNKVHELATVSMPWQ